MGLEGLTRLGGSLLLIALGYGVRGVIAANAAAVALAYFAAASKLAPRVRTDVRLPHAFHEALQAIIFFVGMVLINNCDIVLVKHFFASTEAGLYAAVALVGRVIFSFSWAVVNSMFPIVAGTREKERKGHGLLTTSLLLVARHRFGSSRWCCVVAPAWIWTTFFGAQFTDRWPVRPALPARPLRHHHRDLFPQRGHHRLRDGLQDLQHLGAVGLQRRGGGRHLPLPFLAATSDLGAAGAHAGCC